jgi:hypothetical protein
MSRALFVLILLGGCFESHSGNMKELANQDCYSCHTPDYNGTTMPVHKDNPDVFATSTCANCHRTTSWQPALEGLHDITFIIDSGIHSNIKCLVCHDLDSGQPSKAGANTNCLQCHPNTTDLETGHQGVIAVTGAPYQYLDNKPSFCVDCHPTGRAPKHPDDKFPRTGSHAVPCESCHIRSNGSDVMGMNTTCVSSACHHTLSWSDADHATNDASRTYPTKRDPNNPHFCLASGCHPSGRSG